MSALVLFLNSGCGYIKDKPLENTNVYKTDELQTCKIDATKLSEIFKENQEEQIKCLQKNFIQYTKYVKSSQTDGVNEKEIGDFVRKFFEKQGDSIVKGLSVIFQLNMIMLRDEAKKISRGNITPLFELLLTANREAIIITDSLKEIAKKENQYKFFELRESFKNALERFTLVTIKIMREKEGPENKLNIKQFILEASRKIGTNDVSEKTIDSLIFLKPILVGGNREVISTSELIQIIEKLPKILTLSFDLFYVKKENFKNDSEHAQFILNNFRDFYSLIKFDQANFDLLTIDQLLDLSTKFSPGLSINKNEIVDIRKFKPSIVALKSKIIGGKPEMINLIDAKKILDLVVSMLERIYFDNLTYEARIDLMNSRQIIRPEQLSPIYLKEYSSFTPSRVQELTRNFNSIITKYKYFRKKDDLSLYGISYSRPKEGVIELSSLNFLVEKLLTAYGQNRLGSYQVNLQEFEKFLVDMKPILEELKLWSPNFSTFARNAVFLADLFQHQSNGDFLVNIDEATEYIGMILAASHISTKVREELPRYCDPGINADDPLYQTTCFNQHLFNLTLNELQMKKSFPRLYEYINSSTWQEVQSYLNGLEGFARDDNRPGVPINKRDSILLLGSVVNVETTFIRFDKNLDNVIDYKELLEAFKIYKTAIITLAKLPPEKEGYAVSIFLYMVYKMEVPPTGNWIDDLNFLKFHTCVNNDLCRTTFYNPFQAKRLNIGSLLYYLVNQTTTTKPLKK